MISSLITLCPLLGWLFKAFAWLIVHGKVNTNDMLQLRRSYNALSPDVCLLCMER